MPQSQAKSSKTENVKVISVIDDEAAIAESLTEILNNAGYQARAFQSGHAAIKSARDMCPDIVISDVVMPRMNGVETVLTIQEICAQTRVVLFSGQAGTADILREARAKGHQFSVLPKPIHPDTLLESLARLG
jgi:DNA-binding NtrC family response regulator